MSDGLKPMHDNCPATITKEMKFIGTVEGVDVFCKPGNFAGNDGRPDVRVGHFDGAPQTFYYSSIFVSVSKLGEPKHMPDETPQSFVDFCIAYNNLTQ